MTLLQRLRTMTGVDLRADVIAGISVAFLFVPQAMAYAMLAGVPPIYGLYAASFPGLAYAFIGGSRYMAVGPVAIISLLIASELEPLATPFSPEYIELAMLLGLMVGVLLIGLALLQAGNLVDFIGHPTVVGFNAAAALLTAGSQIRNLFGISAEAAPTATAGNPWPALLALRDSHPLSAGMGLATVAALLVFPRINRKLPAAFIVCVLGSLAAAWLALPAAGLQIVGDVPTGLPRPQVPYTAVARWRELIPGAFSIVIVGFASSISIVRGLATRSRESVEPNRELWGLGIANVISSVFGSFPVMAGLSRSTMNAEAGARSQLALAVSSVIVLACLLVLAPAFSFMPLPVLAALIVVAATRLMKFTEIWRLTRVRFADGATAIGTFAATLFLGLAAGLAIGLGVAIVLFVRRTAVPHHAELGRIPGTMVYRNTLRFHVETCPQAGILRIDAPLYFANARFVERTVVTMFSERPNMNLVLLECSGVSDIDTSALQTLRTMIEDLRAMGGDVHLVAAIGPVRDILRRSGVEALLGTANMHRTILEAAPRIGDAVDKAYCSRDCTVSAFPECTLIPRDRLSRPSAEQQRYAPQI